MKLFSQKFGIPGVISVIALIFALTGGAWAANSYLASSSGKHAKRHRNGKKGHDNSGLSGKQKREVKKIARRFAGRGPAGPIGPAGLPGANGLPGAPGAKGDSGSDGTSVTSSQFGGSKGPCPGGGSEFKSVSGTTFACDGEQGEDGEPGEPGETGDPWTAGGTLPAGETETGAWSAQSPGASIPAISFNIPLATAIPSSDVIFEEPGYEGSSGDDCPGKVSEPSAKEGHVCIYSELLGNLVFTAGLLGFPISYPSGVVMRFGEEELGEGGIGRGTWAVTAPTPAP